MKKINFLVFWIFLFASLSLASGKKAEEIAVCPKCNSTQQVIPIVYGYPGPELMRKAEAGKVMLGGCVVRGDDPKWYCRACGHKW